MGSRHIASRFPSYEPSLPAAIPDCRRGSPGRSLSSDATDWQDFDWFTECMTRMVAAGFTSGQD
jgi:hypothetical protein